MTKKILMIYLGMLTIFLSSCYHNQHIQFDIPKRDMLPVPQFERCNDKYCTTESGLRDYLKRDTLRDAYEEKLVNTINGCNAILK